MNSTRNSKVVNIIEEFYAILNKHARNAEESYIIDCFELEIAKGILQEFGSASAKKVANIILAAADEL